MSKLFLISQDANRGYDTTDSAVVVADTAFNAALIHPSSFWDNLSDMDSTWGGIGNDWCSSPKEVEVEFLADLPEDSELSVGTVVLRSFNAG